MFGFDRKRPLSKGPLESFAQGALAGNLAGNLLKGGKGSSGENTQNADSNGGKVRQSTNNYDFGGLGDGNNGGNSNVNGSGNGNDNTDNPNTDTNNDTMPYNNEQTEQMKDYYNNQNPFANTDNDSINNNPVDSNPTDSENLDDSWRNNLDNNQNAELDTYNNSKAYGNESDKKEENKQKPEHTRLNSAKKIGKHMAKLTAKTLPKATKFAATAAGTGIGALGGFMVASATTGSLAKGFAGAAAGAKTGKHMGGKLGGTIEKGMNNIPNIPSKAREAKRSIEDKVNNFKDEALHEQKTAADNQKKRDIERRKEDFARNKDNRNYFAQKTGATGKALDNVMKQAAQVHSYGDMDNDSILRTLETQEMNKDNGMSDQASEKMATMSAKMASDYGWKKEDFEDDKKLKQMNNIALSEIRKASPELSEEQQKQLASQTIENARYVTGNRKYENANIRVEEEKMKLDQEKSRAKEEKYMEKTRKATEKSQKKYNKNPQAYEEKIHKADQRRKTNTQKQAEKEAKDRQIDEHIRRLEEANANKPNTRRSNTQRL